MILFVKRQKVIPMSVQIQLERILNQETLNSFNQGLLPESKFNQDLLLFLHQGILPESSLNNKHKMMMESLLNYKKQEQLSSSGRELNKLRKLEDKKLIEQSCFRDSNFNPLNLLWKKLLKASIRFSKTIASPKFLNK